MIEDTHQWIIGPQGKAHLFEKKGDRSLCGTAGWSWKDWTRVGPGFDPCRLCEAIVERELREMTMREEMEDEA